MHPSPPCSPRLQPQPQSLSQIPPLPPQIRAAPLPLAPDPPPRWSAPPRRRRPRRVLVIPLQLVNRPDILLQTHSWFPISHALTAVFTFRLTHLTSSAASSSPRRLLLVGLARRHRQRPARRRRQVAVSHRVPPHPSIYVLGVTTAGSDHATQNLRVAFYSVFSAFCLVEVELIGKHIQNSRTTSAMKHISTSARSSPSIRCGGSFVLVRIR